MPAPMRKAAHSERLPNRSASTNWSRRARASSFTRTITTLPRPSPRWNCPSSSLRSLVSLRTAMTPTFPPRNIFFMNFALLSGRLSLRRRQRFVETEGTGDGNEQQQRRAAVEDRRNAEPGSQVAGKQQRNALRYRDERHGTAADAAPHFGGYLSLQQ